MNFKKPMLLTRTFEFKEGPLHVAFVCPSCNSEVGIKEIIERNGRIGCVKCVR
jgi:transcription elongation factor Elf1